MSRSSCRWCLRLVTNASMYAKADITSCYLFKICNFLTPCFLALYATKWCRYIFIILLHIAWFDSEFFRFKDFLLIFISDIDPLVRTLLIDFMDVFSSLIHYNFLNILNVSKLCSLYYSVWYLSIFREYDLM